MKKMNILQKRIYAFFIDLMTIGLLGGVIGVVEDNFLENFRDTNIILYFILLLFILKDTIFKNGSIGKEILKLRIISVSENNTFFRIRKILRNITVIIWPIEFLILLIKNKRLTDIILKLNVEEEG